MPRRPRIRPMLRRRTPSRRATWWLLLAWMLVTLAPSVSRAAAYVQGQIAPWAVVCSALADARDGNGDQRARAAQELQHLTEHCPACTHNGEAWAPPPAANTATAAEPGAALPPRLFLSAPRPLHAWATAQPRAPPARA